MGFIFNRPQPRQSVPQDLTGGRQQILNLIFGTPGGGRPVVGAGADAKRATPGYAQNYQRYLESQGNGGPVLQALMGLINPQTPGGDVLGPLQAQFQQNLDYGMSAINASSPGRFSTANAYTQGQFSQRALNDYNVLAAQTLEQGRNRQLQALMGLLGPVLGPAFGGPFTQGSSPWENILGGVGAAADLFGAGGLFRGGSPQSGGPVGRRD